MNSVNSFPLLLCENIKADLEFLADKLGTGMEEANLYNTRKYQIDSYDSDVAIFSRLTDRGRYCYSFSISIENVVHYEKVSFS